MSRRGTESSRPTVLASKYQVADMIGEGASGKVFKALNLQTGGMVAIKEVVVRKKAAETISELEHEIVLMAQLSHPNIVRYIGTSRTDAKLRIYTASVCVCVCARARVFTREPPSKPSLLSDTLSVHTLSPGMGAGRLHRANYQTLRKTPPSDN